MARAGPRKVTAVRLSQQPGLQVQAVAAALDIHPFTLSKWRKQVRDGVLRRKGRDLTVPPRREISGSRSWSGRMGCSRRSMTS